MTKHEYDRQLVVRMAQHFDATNWGDGARDLDLDTVASFLDVHSPDVALLIVAGVLTGVVEHMQDSRCGREAFGRVDGPELLRFLQEHGEAWVLARLQRTIGKLRDDVAWAERRSEAAREREAEKVVAQALESAAQPTSATNEEAVAA